MASLLGVVADDFTGACDVAVQFRKRGLECVVLTAAESLADLTGKFDVAAIDTESRNLPPETAYSKVRATVKTLKKMGVRLVYKKIDSTLRGNIGAELDAVIDELGLKAVMVAPSFPAHGRTTLDGHLLVNSEPLERTEFAQDPVTPVSESHIPTLMKRQTKRRVAHIDLAEVRAGVDLLKKEIQGLIEKGTQIVVADAETQEDLARIAEASMDSKALLCGSAGLAEEYARLLSPRLGLLVVSGTVNAVTLDQTAAAAEELDIKILEPDLADIMTSEEKLRAEIERLKDEAEEATADGRDVVIRLARSKDLLSKVQVLGKELGMSRLEIAEKLLFVLSESFKRIAANRRFAGVILIGGDTSIRVMNSVAAKGVRIEEEILPGVPMGRILGGDHEGMLVVTKAGGFGDRHALVQIMKLLKPRKWLQ